jgi:hypothetical protein
LQTEKKLPQVWIVSLEETTRMFKTYCENYRAYKEVGHLCYMKLLHNELTRSDDQLFVFYDFETTQETKFTETATLHVSNLVCLQQFCTQCEKQQDIDVDCLRCGKRLHSFLKIQWATSYHISANPVPGVTRS